MANISRREKVCPLALAKFDRTATVLNGWTSAHPSIPPIPDVAKTTELGIAFDDAGEVAKKLWFCWYEALVYMVKKFMTDTGQNCGFDIATNSISQEV